MHDCPVGFEEFERNGRIFSHCTEFCDPKAYETTLDVVAELEEGHFC
jgi:hypothetical protein